MTDRKEIEYKEVDCEGLALCWAEEIWQSTTNRSPESELYEMILEDGELKKQVKPELASSWFRTLKICKITINNYCRYPVPEDEIE